MLIHPARLALAALLHRAQAARRRGLAALRRRARLRAAAWLPGSSNPGLPARRWLPGRLAGRAGCNTPSLLTLRQTSWSSADASLCLRVLEQPAGGSAGA